MTEPMFKIVPQSHIASETENNPPSQYETLSHNFMTTSYGYYTELFINKIAQTAHIMNKDLLRVNVKKTLRDTVNRFLLSDLQLVFVGYYCEKEGWNYKSEQVSNLVQKNCKQQDLIGQQVRSFIQFNTFFVKSYLGDETEFREIHSYLDSISPNFYRNFTKWVAKFDPSHFTVSPKLINQLYSKFTKHSHKFSSKKDYNDLVDSIIELSTTYSIIPAKKSQKSSNTKMKEKRNFLRKQKTEEIAIEEEVEIKIPEKIGKLFSSNNQKSFIDHNYLRGRHNSSAIFEEIFGNNKSNLSSNLRSHIELQKQPAQNEKYGTNQDRSRQKKTTRLTKLRKKQQPNEGMLECFINPPSPEKAHNLRERQGKSILNLRSDISSRSLVLPPLPFKPVEQGFFFDRSRLN